MAKNKDVLTGIMKSKFNMKKKQSLAVTTKRGKYVHSSVDNTYTTNFGTNRTFNTTTEPNVNSPAEIGGENYNSILNGSEQAKI